MNENKATGVLTLVAVPIGNLKDCSANALEALRNARCIACEDTRVTRKLLDKTGIELKGTLLSYREKNERSLALQLADRLTAGEDILLVADAGTPTISDPGFRLVRECRRRGLRVTTAPGANAAITALSISGLPSDRFFYAGFLPPKSAARKRFFKTHFHSDHTIVLYESCHRIDKLLDDLMETLGPDRCICVARELTKIHETVHTGPAGDVRDRILQESRKGEFVVMIAKSGFIL